MMDAMASYIKNNENVSGVKEVYAFLNTGGIRVSSQAAGDLTFADIYEWFPFDNRVVYYLN